jgi:hypothetical protein
MLDKILYEVDSNDMPDNYYTQFYHLFLCIGRTIDSFHWGGNSYFFPNQLNKFVDLRM